MNKILIFFLGLIGLSLYSNEVNLEDIIEVGIKVSVVGERGTDNLSVDFTKHTINKKSVKINLKGFDGELMAMITPTYIDETKLEIDALLEIMDMKGAILKHNRDLIYYTLGDKLFFYPLGEEGDHPVIVLELTLSRVDDNRFEDR